MRRDVMVTVLDTAARERCTFLYPVTVKAYQRRFAVSRIALVSPERSQQIEGILLRMVQSGQLRDECRKVNLSTPRPSAYPVRSTSFCSPMHNQVEEAQGAKTAKKSTIVVRLPCAAFILLCTYVGNQYQRRKDIDEDDFDF